MAQPARETLDQLPLDKPATIISIDDSHNIAERLRELGFSEGQKITALHSGALGHDPIAVKLDQQRLALRCSEAALIEVQRD